MLVFILAPNKTFFFHFRLQEERAAVALSAFLNRSNSMDSMNDLQPYALNGMDISRFTLLQVGNMNSIFLFCFVDKAIHT